MTDQTKENDWIHRMVLACRANPKSADINVVRLGFIIDDIRAAEREAIEKIIKKLKPEIVGTPNDPDSHQRWCDSAAAFSKFESIIAAIRAREDKHD